MPNAQHQVPDYTTDDAAGYKAKIDGNAAVVARIGAAYQAYANSTPNMTVKVAAGALLVAGAVVENAIQTTGTITAPVSNSRIDRVVIDAATGVVSVITGTSGVSPTAPALTAGKLPVAQVLLTSASTAITNSMITDERTVSAGTLDINGLTQDTAPDPDADFVATYDASAGSNKKVKLPGIKLGTAVTWSSGTAVDFTGIPSSAKRIKVMLDSVSTNGSSNLVLQIGDSGGIETSGYTGGMTQYPSNAANSASFNLSFMAGSSSVSGTITLDLMNSSSSKWTSAGVLADAAGSCYHSAGVKSLSATLDRVRITTAGGADTGDGGSINVSWE